LKKFLLLCFLSILLVGCSNNLSPEETVDSYFDTYNKKNYDGFYDLASDSAKKEIEKNINKSKAESRREWEKNVQPIEVINIKEQSKGSDKETFVVAEIHAPSTILRQEYSEKKTFKLVEENGIWKIEDDHYDSEPTE
jgi:hypothetical protein